jgi:hypothetical protein
MLWDADDADQDADGRSLVTDQPNLRKSANFQRHQRPIFLVISVLSSYQEGSKHGSWRPQGTI